MSGSGKEGRGEDGGSQPPREPQTGRFAVLYHEAPAAMGGPHWDLLVEVPGQERLATWHLTLPPERWPPALVARKIADHRRVYLTYEGPVSGDRGIVRRVEEGTAQILQHGSPGPQGIPWRIALAGRIVRGIFELADA